MKTKILIEKKTVPCLVGQDLKAFFHGFNESGQAMVELENGQLANWDASEVRLLDSKSRFNNYYWDLLVKDHLEEEINRKNSIG